MEALEGRQSVAQGASPGGVTARRTYALVALGLAAFVVYGSLVPFAFRPRPWDDARRAFAWAMENRAVPQSRSDGLANLLLAVPLGFALLGAGCADRSGARRAWLWAAAGVPACAGLAAAVEFAQLYLPTRTCAGSDVIAQALGAALGMVLWAARGQWFTRHARAIWAKTDGAAPRLLIGYLALLAFVQALPLDLSPRPADLYRKFRDTVRYVPFGEFRGAGEIECWQRIATLCQVFALYLPVGLLASRLGAWFSPLPQCFVGGEGKRGSASAGEGAGASALGDASPPSPGVEATPTSPPMLHWGRGGSPEPTRLLLLAFLVALGMEAVQLVVHSRTPSATDVIVGAAGALCGWALGQQKAAWWMAVVWCSVLTVHAWQPWTARSTPAAFDWVPGLPLEGGDPLHALEEFLTKAALFAPLGLFVPRRFAPVFGMAVAAVLEVGQLFVSSRYPGVTDVLIGGFGAWAAAHIAAGLHAVSSSRPERTAGKPAAI